MRHKISGNRLNRQPAPRRAAMRDLAKATLSEQRVLTTKAKAKEARKLVEQLITLGKKGSLADKRRAFSILCDHQLVSELFNKTSPRFRDRIGGYTRIIPLGKRRGDGAKLVFLELTEKEEIIISKNRSSEASKKIKAKAQPKDVEVESGKKEEKKADFTKVSQSQEGKKTPAQPKPTDIKTKGDKKQGRFGGLGTFFNRKSSGDK